MDLSKEFNSPLSVMVRNPKYPKLNFGEIEKAGGLKLEDQHRRDHLIDVYFLQILQNKRRRRTLYFQNQKKRLEGNLKLAQLARQMLEVFNRNCSSHLFLYKKCIMDLAEKAPKLDRRRRGQPNKTKLTVPLYSVFETWKDAGGKGVGSTWSVDKITQRGTNKGKSLDLICKLFDQSEIDYSRDKIALEIRHIGGYFNKVQKAGGVPGIMSFICSRLKQLSVDDK